MDAIIQEVMNWDITNWILSDTGNLMRVMGTILVLGALNGVRLSLAHSERRRR